MTTKSPSLVIQQEDTARFKKNTRQKIWNNMKIQRAFSIASVVSSLEVPKTTAYAYIRPLHLSGYLQKSGKNKYRFIRDTGRLAPIVRKLGCWDQNLMTLFLFNDALKES